MAKAWYSDDVDGARVGQLWEIERGWKLLWRLDELLDIHFGD